MVGAITTFFVAFNMIADDLADKIGYRISISQVPYAIFDSIYENCEFIKTKKDHKYIYNKIYKEMGAKPCFILLHCIWNWWTVGGH